MRIVIALAVCLMVPICALAQTQPPVAASAASTARSNPMPAKAPAYSAVDPAQTAAALMKSNGGSLLRATLAAQPDPSQAKVSQVSFFAVPAPEPKTIKKHDLVTIIIREASEFKSSGTSDLKKE